MEAFEHVFINVSTSQFTCLEKSLSLKLLGIFTDRFEARDNFTRLSSTYQHLSSPVGKACPVEVTGISTDCFVMI